MRRDFDDIILCIPALSFLLLNIFHLPASFFAATGNVDMLLMVAAPTAILDLIAIIPIIASLVFLIIFRSELLAELMTILAVGLFIYQGYIFWANILPIMLTYVESIPIPFG